MMLPDDLGQMYIERLTALQEMSLPDLEQVVSGKYVLELLRGRFPLRQAGVGRCVECLSLHLSRSTD
jgi:hypothetical protein